MRKTPQPPPGRETTVPDMNAGAPRPRKMPTDDSVPTMDKPPKKQSDTHSAFDRGTKEADREARWGTVPGPDDFDAQKKEGRD